MSFVLLSRKFARFVLGHPVPIVFRTWIKDTLNPDESYFNTLARITNLKKVRGLNEFIVNTSNTLDTIHDICLRAVKWKSSSNQCFGIYVREVCHLTLQDFLEIYQQKPNCFAANKFNLDVDPKPILFLARHLSPFKYFSISP